MKRHPRSAVLAAWFDGEETGEGIAPHVASCPRCLGKIQELGRVRAAVRGELVAPTGAVPVAVRRSPLRPVLVGLTALAVVLVAIGVTGWQSSGPQTAEVVSQAGPEQSPSPVRAAPSAPEVATGSSRSAAAGTSGSGGSVRASASERGPAAGEPAAAAAGAQPGVVGASSSEGPASQLTPAQATAHPLRLGVLVPAADPSVNDGREMQMAAQQVVAAANANGGVAGQPVVLKVLDPRKPIEGVDALVGGSGLPAPAGVPWLLPADPTLASKDVVRAEPSAEAAGEALGAELRDRDRVRSVGVIVGDGPDAALRDGLDNAVAVISEPARPHTDCQREVRDLLLRTPSALAIAGSPDLVELCLAAAARSGWTPAAGVVVPPSLAYAEFDPAWSGLSVRTALGLPGPMGTDPGATRFRTSTGFTSYRALVTFAATELAIAVARTSGSVTAAGVAKGSWYSDLLHFDGVENHGVAIARASAVGWSR